MSTKQDSNPQLPSPGPVISQDKFLEIFTDVYSCLKQDREDARDAYSKMADRVFNSTAATDDENAEDLLPQLLQAVGTFDKELVKVAQIASAFVKPAPSRAGAAPKALPAPVAAADDPAAPPAGGINLNVLAVDRSQIIEIIEKQALLAQQQGRRNNRQAAIDAGTLPTADSANPGTAPGE